jgi:alpha-L-fucosidase
MLTVYYGSVGGNGQFLLNIPPDRRGLFHENDVARLKEIGDVLRKTFSQDLAAGARLTAEVSGGESAGEIAAVLDGDPDTFWTTTCGAASATITMDLPAAVRANCLMLQEHIASGQRVERFDVEVLADGKWRQAGRGTVIGHKRLVRFPDATIDGIRIGLTQFRIRPTLAGLGLYLAPAILPSAKVAADVGVMVKANWRILDCDSQDGEEGAAENAIDGDPATFWHSRYRDRVDPMPHHIAVDLGEVVTVCGFAYTPRQDRWDGGIVMRARFEVSRDGKNWTVAADDVAFDNIVNSRRQQVVRLETSTAARYFRMTALRTANDSDLASAADISVLVE